MIYPDPLIYVIYVPIALRNGCRQDAADEGAGQIKGGGKERDHASKHHHQHEKGATEGTTGVRRLRQGPQLRRSVAAHTRLRNTGILAVSLSV